MKIVKKIVDSRKHHTAGYIMSNGQEMSVTQAVRSVESIDGVRVGSNQNGHKFLTSTTGKSLKDLSSVVRTTSDPIVHAANRRKNARKSGQYLTKAK